MSFAFYHINREGEKKMSFAFYHINKGNFKDTQDHYWLVGFNEGGIGTPLLDLTPDVQYFIEKDYGKYKQEAEARLKSQATLTAEIESLKADKQRTKEALERFFEKGVPWSIKLEEAKEVLKKELGI